MTTTMIPHPSPSPSPGARPGPGAPGDPVRFVAVRANLMPDEVLNARRTDAVRRRVLIALGVLLVLLLGGFATAWLQTVSANGDLSDQQHRTAALQSQQHDYAPLVAAQAQTADIDNKLHLLMVGDVRWQPMYATVRSDAPAGLGITSMAAQISTAAAGGAAPPGSANAPVLPLNAAGTTPIGTLTVIGTVDTKDQLAGFADKLATVPGLVSPFVQKYDSTQRPFTFTVSAIITVDALGGRYHVSDPSTSTTVPGGN